MWEPLRLNRSGWLLDPGFDRINQQLSSKRRPWRRWKWTFNCRAIKTERLMGLLWLSMAHPHLPLSPRLPPSLSVPVFQLCSVHWLFSFSWAFFNCYKDMRAFLSFGWTASSGSNGDPHSAIKAAFSLYLCLLASLFSDMCLILVLCCLERQKDLIGYRR